MAAKPYHEPHDLENWYADIEAHTFPTRFVDVSYACANGMVHAFDDMKYGSKKCTPEEAALIQDLKAKIQEIIDQEYHDGVFVRLSTKSPKDVVLKSEKLRNMIRDQLATSQSDVDDVIAVVSSCSRACGVKTGEEAVTMIVSSERTRNDLLIRCLNCTKDDFSMKMAVRKFVNIRPEMEFRAFVHKGVLTACTQYYAACYVPQIAADAANIERRIVAKFEAIKGLIKLPSYVIDFVVTDDDILVVELNNYDHTTAPSLFNWTADAAVLHDGPFEFRVLREPLPDGRGLLHGPLKALLDELKPRPKPAEPAPAPSGGGSNCVIA